MSENKETIWMDYEAYLIEKEWLDKKERELIQEIWLQNCQQINKELENKDKDGTISDNRW